MMQQALTIGDGEYVKPHDKRSVRGNPDSAHAVYIGDVPLAGAAVEHLRCSSSRQAYHPTNAALIVGFCTSLVSDETATYCTFCM